MSHVRNYSIGDEWSAHNRGCPIHRARFWRDGWAASIARTTKLETQGRTRSPAISQLSGSLPKLPRIFPSHSPEINDPWVIIIAILKLPMLHGTAVCF